MLHYGNYKFYKYKRIRGDSNNNAIDQIEMKKFGVLQKRNNIIRQITVQ